MDSVLITSTTGREIKAELLRDALGKHWHVEGSGPDGVVVLDSKSRVYIHNADSLGDPSPIHLLIDYSDEAFAARVITVIASSPDLLVETECEQSMPGDQFVAKVATNPRWSQWPRGC